MSYCVRCGVELADYEKKCPLCGTIVIDPERRKDCDPLFPERIDWLKEKKVNKSFALWLVFIVMLFPFAVTTVIDLIFSFGLIWSAYVLGAELCIWILFVFPFQFSGVKPYWYCLADAVAASGYLFLISVLVKNREWYLPLALPLVLLSAALGVLNIAISRRRIGKIAKLGWSIIPLGCFLCGVDITITHYTTGSFLPMWAWFVTIPLLVFGIVAIIISKSVRLSEWIRRKMFI